MESVKVEDYLKAIYQIATECEAATASTGELAEQLQVTPGSVTTMLQRLSEAGLVIYQSHRGARLTEEGEKRALSVLRRHRLVELFLVKTLGLKWDEIHEEAENLEHAVSERLIDLIDQHLDYPDRDPHGDPIPGVDGRLRGVTGVPLSSLTPKTVFILEQVVDQTPEFLRYLTEGGLVPGRQGSMLENYPAAGIVSVLAGDRRLSLSCEIARKLLVRVLPG